MSKIGTFTMTTDGNFNGTVLTLRMAYRLNIHKIAATENGPAYRVYAGDVEVGAGWVRQAKESGNTYIAITLEDPTFQGGAIHARLSKDKEAETYSLYWDRKKASSPRLGHLQPTDTGNPAPVAAGSPIG